MNGWKFNVLSKFHRLRVTSSFYSTCCYDEFKVVSPSQKHTDSAPKQVPPRAGSYVKRATQISCISLPWEIPLCLILLQIYMGFWFLGRQRKFLNCLEITYPHTRKSSLLEVLALSTLCLWASSKTWVGSRSPVHSGVVVLRKQNTSLFVNMILPLWFWVEVWKLLQYKSEVHKGNQLMTVTWESFIFLFSPKIYDLLFGISKVFLLLWDDNIISIKFKF